MKNNVIVLLLMVLGVWQLASAAEYTTMYDNVDLDEILGNERLYKKYFDCLVGDGKCTPDGKELKDKIPDALANKCGNCNEKQKAGVEKALKHMIKKRPDDWAKIQKIYDPDGKYKTLYKDDAKNLFGVDLR